MLGISQKGMFCFGLNIIRIIQAGIYREGCHMHQIYKKIKRSGFDLGIMSDIIIESIERPNLLPLKKKVIGLELTLKM